MKLSDKFSVPEIVDKLQFANKTRNHPLWNKCWKEAIEVHRDYWDSSLEIGQTAESILLGLDPSLAGMYPTKKRKMK